MAWVASEGVSTTQISVNAGELVVSHLLIFAKAGDILIARFMAEFTNNNTVPIGLGTYLVYGTGQLAVPKTMENITPEMHHKVFSRTSYMLVEADQNVIVSFVAYAAAIGSNFSALPIEYGRADMATMKSS